MVAIALLGGACTEGVRTVPTPPSQPQNGRIDVGGYELAWQCRGQGTPTVMLDAGLGTAGTSEWFDFLPQLDPIGTRVCTYDRAGTGTSDPRPDGEAPRRQPRPRSCTSCSTKQASNRRSCSCRIRTPV